MKIVRFQKWSHCCLLWTATEQLTRTTINRKYEEEWFYFLLKSWYPVAFQKYGLGHQNKNRKINYRGFSELVSLDTNITSFAWHALITSKRHTSIKTARVKEIVLSFNRAFLSIHTTKHCIQMFRGNNRLSYFLHLWLFESDLRKDCGYLCMMAFTPQAAFLGRSFVVRLKVKGLLYYMKFNDSIIPVHKMIKIPSA